MYLIDTNIFLELLLNGKNAKECEKFLEKVSKGEIKAIVSSFTLHAVEAFLGKNHKAIQLFVRNILNSEGLKVYSTTLEEELEASVIAEKIGLDFDDGLQYFIAKKLQVKAIVSFDRHFDKTDLKKVTPKQVIE